MFGQRVKAIELSVFEIVLQDVLDAFVGAGIKGDGSLTSLVETVVAKLLGQPENSQAGLVALFGVR